MKRMVRILALAAATLGLPSSIHAASIQLQLVPASQTVQVGQQATVDMVISGTDAGAPPSVGAFDISIDFDPGILSPAEVTFSNFLGDPLAFEALTDVFLFVGEVNVAGVSLLPSSDLHVLQPDTFPLARILFNVIGPGTSRLAFGAVTVDDTEGLKLPFGTTSGDITAVPEPATLTLVGFGLPLVVRALRRRSRVSPRISSYVVCLVLMTSGAAAQELTVTEVPPPNRGGLKDRTCPPNWDRTTGTKSPLDPTKGDKNAADDKRYYMGETKLVLTAADGSTTNLIVRDWCIAKDPTDRGAGENPRYLPGDFFSNEILTSKNGIETVRIEPGTPC